MEDYNITYKSKTFAEIDHLTHAINGPQCYNLSQYMGAGQDMEKIHTKNFMKVYFSCIAQKSDICRLQILL